MAVERIIEFTPEFVVLMPERKDMKDGILYISDEYELAIHRCFCGCGEQTVTPIDADGWTLKNVDGKISLNPSIGNQKMECGSHYFIRENRVEWL